MNEHIDQPETDDVEECIGTLCLLIPGHAGESEGERDQLAGRELGSEGDRVVLVGVAEEAAAELVQPSPAESTKGT